MTKITNKEEAVKMIEICAIKEAEATKNGDYKTNNKYARYEAECTKYLYQHGQLQALYEYLEHENPSVRLSAAYALLPLYEENCKKVLSELVKGNYGMCGLDAKMILKQWNTGELIFPYQNNQIKKSNPKKENETSIKVEQENGEVFSPAILRLSRIFGCPPANDTELRNEDCGFYVKLNQETQKLTVNVNTFVNPYTQDVVAVYKKRLERFKAFEHVATISAEQHSKLGFMKILLTIPMEKSTDDVLIQIKDTIYLIYNEWKPNETLVCFKVEYIEATSYFEGEWWMPKRAVIKNKSRYERYDFSDEMKYDEAMWELVQGEYDEFENSDSFALIAPTEFQKIWDSTEYCYMPKPY